MPDLWPADIAKTTTKPPVSILREQAALLGEKTKNLVKAEVRLDEDRGDNAFGYDFFIIGPALQNYHFKLFSIGHDIDLYPLVVFLDQDITRELKLPSNVVKADDENELLSLLKQ